VECATFNHYQGIRLDLRSFIGLIHVFLGNGNSNYLGTYLKILENAVCDTLHINGAAFPDARESVVR
jgi:hypothetical protein